MPAWMRCEWGWEVDPSASRKKVTINILLFVCILPISTTLTIVANRNDTHKVWLVTRLFSTDFFFFCYNSAKGCMQANAAHYPIPYAKMEIFAIFAKKNAFYVNFTESIPHLL